MTELQSTFEEYQSIIESSLLLFIKVGSTTCGPCKVLQPHFDELALANKSIKFIRVNLDVIESKAKTEPSAITKPPTALLNTSTKDVIQEAEPRKSTASWRRKSQSNLDKGKKKGGKCTIL
ncbi:hypothetical protein HDV06_002656 [Boothiomyces sp. JEL0866]|nr:hypothetical protein HDV06_002656 [Boothiomyces sp. JEL0866]